jgi:HAE1 family hydrophobic/amphiphilic exporter-1
MSERSSQSAGAGGRKLAAFSIRKPVTICMIFVTIVLMGTISLTKIPLMLIPSFDAPVLYVHTSYPNATPEQILESITKPLEEVLATIPGVKRMSSYTSEDSVHIQIFCGMAADVALLRAEIREKIDRIRGDLPDDLRLIRVQNFNTDEIPIIEGSISAKRDLRSDYDFLDAKIKKPLERIRGVGNVEIYGASRKQVDIYLRLDDLKRYQVDVARLFRTLDSSNLNISLGPVEDAGMRYAAVAKGTTASLDDLRNFPVNERGLVLSDIAEIRYDERDRDSGRHLNGELAIGFWVQKTSEANTVDTVNGIMALAETWKDDPALEGLEVMWWHNAGDEIYKGLVELLKAGLIGSILSVLVLFLFLRRLDASLVIGLAIPFSIVAAIGFLYVNGSTLNTLSMMGLMLAAGMLVDNAVVVLESIFQRLEQGEARKEASVVGAGDVTMAVIAATATSMIIFVPLLFDSDSQLSIMLGHVGLSIIFALSCSLFISLTLIPLALSRYLNIDVAKHSRFETGLTNVLLAPSRFLVKLVRRKDADARSRTSFSDKYLAWVGWHLHWPKLTGLVVVPLILAGAVFVLQEVVPDTSPDAQELSELQINYEFSENFHYAKIEHDYVSPVEAFLAANQTEFKIKSTMSDYGNNRASTRVYFDKNVISAAEMPAIREKIDAGLPIIPGAEIKPGRQEGAQSETWVSANIFGDNPTVLGGLAAEAKNKLQEFDDFGDVYAGLESPRREVQLRMKRAVASKYNISAETVGQVLGMTVRARQMRGFRTPEGETEMWVGLHPADMQSIEDLKSVIVGGSPDGEQITLEQVAEFSVEKVPGRIRREDRRTFTSVNGAFTGQKKEEGRKAMKEVLDSLTYPPGYGWSYGFWTQQQDEDTAQFFFNLALSMVMVYFVMAALFESVFHPFAIMLSMPFAIVGIAVFLLVTGTPFNMMAWVGVIVLVGIVVNNGIVMIDHINNLRRAGLGRHEAILRGCSERLRPIAMTAATTIVGLIPLAWGSGGLFDMKYFPLARTVIGGLMASTLLTLVVLPTYYLLLDNLSRWILLVWYGSDPDRASV